MCVPKVFRGHCACLVVKVQAKLSGGQLKGKKVIVVVMVMMFTFDVISKKRCISTMIHLCFE